VRSHLIFVFFFFSGMTGLVFEVIWSRMLTQVFGSTTFAISALLTAFMSGLALGSEWAGRRAERLKRPVRLYGAMEVGIGLYALVVPALLGALQWLYAPLFRELYGSYYVFSLLRFVLVFVALVLPTVLMGATLPILSAHLSRLGGPWVHRAGLLYGINTFGACVGTLLAGFVALPRWGLSTTNTTFALMSCTLGTSVVLWDALTGKAGDVEVRAPSDEPDADATEPASEPSIDPSEAEAIPARWGIPVVLTAFGVASAVTMAYQVLWTRAYLMVLGSSTYSFTVILGTFLVGLSGGTALASGLLSRIRRPAFVLSLTQLLAASFAAVCFFTLNRLPELQFMHLRQEGHTAGNVFVHNFFLVALVVLLPTLLSGMTFPLVVKLVAQRAVQAREGAAGALVGRAYALGTIGSIVGSFASGFILLPALGLRWAMMGVIGLQIAVGLGVALVALQARPAASAGAAETGEPRRRARRIATLAAAALCSVSLLVAAPELNLTRLSSGAFRAYWARELFTPETFLADNPELLFYSDGVAATISVEQRGRQITLKANGKPEASTGADMATQILVGLLPLVLHEATPEARRAVAAGTYQGARDVAMVGFGSGVTAGASLTYPLEHMDVVEIEAAMIDASRFFDPVNHQPLTDPRVSVIESDGRNFLEYTDARYDVIVSEPSNPWIAGVASLFTMEHFERARAHLKPGGVYCQWVQLYELRAENVMRIFKTFSAVFPHVIIFSSHEKSMDLIMIGSEEALVLGPEGFPWSTAHRGVRFELERAGVYSPHDLTALLFATPSDVAPWIANQERELGHSIVMNTDDNAILEYDAPLDVIHYAEADRFFSSIYFGDTIYGDPRPFLDRFDDPDLWTADDVARAAYSAFVKGKQRLALELATTALERGECRLARQVALAARLYLGGAEPWLLSMWPFPNSEIHRVLTAAIAQQAPIPALEFIYGSRTIHNDRFADPEAALATAWLLHVTGHDDRAHRIVETLINEDGYDARTPLVHLLHGLTWTRRRRYTDAYAAFVRFADAIWPAPASTPEPRTAPP